MTLPYYKKRIRRYSSLSINPTIIFKTITAQNGEGTSFAKIATKTKIIRLIIAISN